MDVTRCAKTRRRTFTGLLDSAKVHRRGYAEMISSRLCKSSREGDRGEPTGTHLLDDHRRMGGVSVLAAGCHVCTASTGQEGRVRGPQDLPPRWGSHLARQD